MDEYYQRRQQIATLLAQERRETRMMAGHQREDFIVNCSLFGRTCSFLNITPFLSKDYGNCYTIVNHDVKASQTGPATALDLTLNLESEEFVTSFKTGYGLRVVLHEEGTRAFPSSEGFTVSSGAETNIGVKLTQITRMGGQYGDCQQEHEHNETGYKYTIMNCRDQCLKKAMMEECQCVSPDDGVNTPNDTVQYCSTLQEFRCLKGVYEDYYNSTERGEDMCQCFNPCNELVYSPTLSSRPWPVLSFVETLEEQVCRDRGDSPKCAYTNQVFTVESADTRRASFARIRLYYERLNYEIVEESPFYNTERFLSDIGGTLGLWIGVTVLGLAELLELLLLCLIFCCKRFKTSNRLQP
ncbi:hypothetical protein V1264_022704 [Littorina saxatilis]|uniref:Uncharacterized protein n=2 Tax=Littorina saxatilis TaxID=31220 RepID=A0AAN9G980_9CAEN